MSVVVEASSLSPAGVVAVYEACVAGGGEVVPETGGRLRIEGANSVGAAALEGAQDEREACVGWFDNPDGTVDLEGWAPVLSRTVMEVLVACDAHVTVTRQATVRIHGLQAGAAEMAVRILAPLGMSFDAAVFKG